LFDHDINNIIIIAEQISFVVEFYACLL
jgi:hypothetical protein